MKNNTILVVLTLLLFITACNQVLTPSNRILSTTTESTPTLKLPVPTATVAASETQLSPTDSTNNSSIYAYMIEPGNLVEQTSDFCLVGEIPDFFWDGNANVLHYAYAIRNRCAENGDQQASWGSFDLMNNSFTTTAPIYKYDRQVWSNLGIESPRVYPQIRGYISPSGNIIIYPITLDNERVNETVTQIWLASADGQTMKMIMELRYIHTIFQIEWFENEKRAIMEISGEGGGDLYLVDVSTSTATHFSEVTEFMYGVGGDWQLSPNEEYLAVPDCYNSQLWIISMKDGKAMQVDGAVNYPTWSTDSSIIYYWAGSQYDIDPDIGTDLMRYDIKSEEATIALSVSALNESLGFVPWGRYSVSQGGTSFAFAKGDEIWILNYALNTN